MSENTTTHYRACNLCEAICGLKIETRGKEIISIKGDKDDPFSKGYLCPKAVALQDIYKDKNRLKQPVRRTKNGWESISWEEAYDEVTDNLKRIQKEYGNSAVGSYLGNPNAHNFGSILFLPDFLRSLKTPNLFSATSADQLPHHYVSHQMFGHYFAIPICDVDRTDYMLIMGANPLVSNGSLMTAPGFRTRMKGIQERGKVVVIDPRKSETADKANEHHFIKPGSDALFLLSILNVFFAEELVELGHLKDHVNKAEEIATLVKEYPPEKTAEFTQISASETRRIAREFATAERAVCYGRMGLSTQEFGGLCIWLVNLVNIFSNNFDKAGGAMFTTPAMDTVVERNKGKVGRWKSRVSQRPERFGELPASVMIEEIITPGTGQIKAMITAAGNPVLSTPNGATLEKGLKGLEYMVSIDIYINETTKYANIILPPTTGLETSNYDTVFHLLAVQNTAKYSSPTFEKTEEQRHDYEILQALTKRMNPDYAPRFSTPEAMVDGALRYGPYAKTGISLQELKDNPQGMDLGSLRPCLPERLFTEDKKVDLAPLDLKKDLERLSKVFFSEKEKNRQRRFQLIGRRDLRTNNSWMHNSPRLVKGGNRCTLLIHPDDAAALKIANKQEVKVASKTGTLSIQAEISEEVMSGVVSIPHGWGHDRKGIQLDVAAAHPGVSINDVTDDKFMDELTGNAAFNGVWVTLD